MRGSLNEELNKINGLFSRASFSQLTREKNMIIYELQSSFNELDSNLNTQLSNNAIKRAELERLTQTNVDIRSESEKTKYKTCIISMLQKRSSSEYIDKIRKSLNALDGEITRYNNSYRPYKNLGNESVYKLMDINLQKLEDLVFALRERRITVEQGIGSIELINSEFGSVPCLMDKYNDLLVQTSRDLEIERMLSKDPITKRRKMSQLTSISARNLSIFLQDQFRTKVECSKTIENETKDEKCMDFDDFVKEKNFALNKATKEELRKKLFELQMQTQEVEKEYAHLVKSNNSVNSSSRSRNTRVSGNIERLESMCEALMQKYFAHREVLEQIINDIDDISHNLIKIGNEKNEHEKLYLNLLNPIRDILIHHQQVYMHLTTNQTKVRMLFSIISAMALELWKGFGEIYEYISHAQIPSLNSLIINPKYARERIPQNKSFKTAHWAFMKFTTPKKGAKNNGSILTSFMNLVGKNEPNCNTSEITSISPNDEEDHNSIPKNELPECLISPSDESPKCIFLSSPPLPDQIHQIYSFFSLIMASHCGGFLFGQKMDLKYLLTELGTHLLGTLYNSISDALKSHGEMRNKNFNQMRSLTNLVLIKEKSMVGMQTEKKQTNDEAVMTDNGKRK